ncbi:uncharacterized protein LOC124921234 [Impatiens glandulifera]|uniref:uncharacterized protein LOC124921234 n=1 Tax=Impatiens glandulifera TaxID=253017 RepID=UPI001FB0C2E1|nr:uncharacterized protein LOC124921234 [Impatiens glandulifera]XP_047317817.1 uncharacterized protein LOC124921234 [Impatiens glandulifera]
MSQGQEAAELMRMNDSLSELPDDILNKITCMMDIQDAVRTSILSKRWRYICSKMFESLLSIKLQSIDISNLELTEVLEKCPLLEKLTLRSCSKLTSLRIGHSNNTHLKILSLENCFNLREIDVSANNLHTLELRGVSRWSKFDIKTPRLVNALCHDISMFESLIFPSKLSAQNVDGAMPALPIPRVSRFSSLRQFSTVRRLVLSVSPFSKNDRLLWVSYIFMAFPLLETLELNLFCPKRQPKEIWKDVLDKCPNRSITKLELNGFAGNHHEVYLLRYLLENLSGLRVLSICPSEKVYNSCDGWVNGKESILGKEWFENHSGWVRSIISPSVHLEFLYYHQP